MEKLKIYWHPNCSTCKKAKKFLNSKKLDYTLVDLREEAPSKASIGKMFKAYADAPKRLFNTSGQAYREKGLKEVIGTLSTADMTKLLAEDGLLVKRPFVLRKDGRGVVGFKEDEWKAFLA